VAGGILRGRRLTAPRSRTRPTQDRVRQALFNMFNIQRFFLAFHIGVSLLCQSYTPREYN